MYIQHLLFLACHSGASHVVYMDNFFTGLKLLDDLSQHDIFAAGTIRANKLSAIPELTDKASLQTMKRGNSKFRSKGNNVVTVWKDKKHIHFLSNVYPAEDNVTVGRKRKEDGVIEQVN